MKRIAILVVGMGLLAGCGGSSSGPAPYTKAATDACVTSPRVGITLSPKVDFVASTASQGAVKMHFAQNDATVLFAKDADEANNLAEAYRRFHAKNVGIEDILRVKNNVVLLWRLHPSDDYEQMIEGCLK